MCENVGAFLLCAFAIVVVDLHVNELFARYYLIHSQTPVHGHSYEQLLRDEIDGNC